jgi:hypothetical protein
MNLKSLQSVAETYLAMLRPKAAASALKPKWVPASITEENVAAFVQAVTEARKANQSVVKFKGKKYAIKSIKEEASEEADQGEAKKLQDVSTANALKQPSDEVPDEVKEEDAEEIKMDNHDEKEADADEMPELDEPKLSEEDEDEEDSDKKGDEEDDNGDDEVEVEAEVEEELVGNQHKLDMDKDGEIDAEDLKKLRGEETGEDEENEEEEDEKDSEEDEKEEDEKPKLTGEQTIASVAATYAAMVNGNVAEGAPGDAKAGPEVMDPATQKMKDAHDDETEITDKLPSKAQDGSDDVKSADKPAAANSSAALPKVKVITAPVMTNEGMTAIVTRKNSDGSYDEVGMSKRTVVRGSHSNILKKAKEYAKGPHRVELFHGDRIGHAAPHKVIHSE